MARQNQHSRVRIVIQEVSNGYGVELVTGPDGKGDELVFPNADELIEWLEMLLDTRDRKSRRNQ